MRPISLSREILVVTILHFPRQFCEKTLWTKAVILLLLTIGSCLLEWPAERALQIMLDSACKEKINLWQLR
jgi:hypothetical protein